MLGTLGFFINGKKKNETYLTTPPFEEIYQYGNIILNLEMYTILNQDISKQEKIDLNLLEIKLEIQMSYIKLIRFLKKLLIMIFFIKINSKNTYGSFHIYFHQVLTLQENQK